MERKVNILHLRATNFYGGPEKQIVEHLKRLDSERFNGMLASFVAPGNCNQLLKEANMAGISCHEIPANAAFDFRSVNALRKILLNARVDLVCAHGYKSNVVGRLATWQAGIPLIAISHGWTGETLKVKIYETIEKCSFFFTDFIVAVSKAQQEKIIKFGVQSRKIRVIYNGINLEPYNSKVTYSIRRELEIPFEKILIVSAGRLSPEKNFTVLIEASKIIKERCPDCIFIIFGEGFLRKKLEKKIMTAGLKDTFFLPGFNPDFPLMLHDADIFVLPSLTEGFPVVLLEACAQKKPIVATSVGGNPEIVIHNETGFLVENPKNYKMLAQYIEDLVLNSSLRIMMGDRGYNQVKKNFSFEIQTANYEELYRKMIDTKKV